MAVIRKALAGLHRLSKEVYVSFNVSPANIVNGAVSAVLAGAALPRIVLEITEHAEIADYAMMGEVLEPLRKQGLRVAIDDAGAGYASFRHILRLRPDIIKLDMSLTRNVDTDRMRRALAAALIGFAEETGSSIVAEGVETDGELAMLRKLGVTKAQGYRLGRPAPIEWAASLRVGGVS
jgi:EAL domain-containing protein (putative c-di-GMP-specific phosphodiesterase class I)